MRWDRYSSLCQIFDKFSVAPLLAVIPDCQDPDLLKFPQVPVDLWEHLREKRSQRWSIAQHGDQHIFHTESAGVLGINRRSEFAGLSFEEQRDMLERGKKSSIPKAYLQIFSSLPPTASTELTY